jgi:superoxide dismutase
LPPVLSFFPRDQAVEDLNAASQAQDIKKQIALQAAIKINGGGALPFPVLSRYLETDLRSFSSGHINHVRIPVSPLRRSHTDALLLPQSLFWENLAPSSSGGGQFPSSGALAEQVEKDFGGLEGLKKAINTAALGIQGSGWAWLGYNPSTKKVRPFPLLSSEAVLILHPPNSSRLSPPPTRTLSSATFPSSVSTCGSTLSTLTTFVLLLSHSLPFLLLTHLPVLHYLQKNVKPAYLDAIWNVINWKEAEARLSKA